jgi:hypothetical protein
VFTNIDLKAGKRVPKRLGGVVTMLLKRKSMDSSEPASGSTNPGSRTTMELLVSSRLRRRGEPAPLNQAAGTVVSPLTTRLKVCRLGKLPKMPAGSALVVKFKSVSVLARF